MRSARPGAPRPERPRLGPGRRRPAGSAPPLSPPASVSLTGFISARSWREPRPSPKPRLFQEYLFVERMMCFADTKRGVQRWRALYLTGDVSVGAAIMLSQRGLQLCERSQTAPPVSKHLTEFILSRAQAFPVKCLSPLCPALVLPTHYVGTCPLLVRSSSTRGPFSQKGTPDGLVIPCFELLSLWFKQRCYSVVGYYKELERMWNTVTCIFSDYTGKKFSCIFVSFGLVLWRLFNVEHDKQWSSKHFTK